MANRPWSAHRKRHDKFIYLGESNEAVRGQLRSKSLYHIARRDSRFGKLPERRFRGIIAEQQIENIMEYAFNRDTAGHGQVGR